MSKSVRFSDAILINKNSGFLKQALKGASKAYAKHKSLEQIVKEVKQKKDK